MTSRLDHQALLRLCFVLHVFTAMSSRCCSGLYLNENSDYVYVRGKSTESESDIKRNPSTRADDTRQLLKQTESIKTSNRKAFEPLWYLNKFGYLDTTKQSKMSANLIMLPAGAQPFAKSNSSSSQEQLIEEAVKKFQRFAKLNMTGKLDNETLRVMKMPRCGHPDILDGSDFLLNSSNKRFNYDRSPFLKRIDSNQRKSDPNFEQKRRKKRYALQGSKWSKSKLKFRIGKYPMYSMLTKEQIDEELKRAFDLWSEVSDVEFEQVKDTAASKSSFSNLMLFNHIPFAVGAGGKKADIDVRFETGFHGDSEPFDGSGLILGHAYFPEFGGSTHFDADEFWTSKSTDGVNLFQVAVHEFGHALGLEHSDNYDAIMAPFFR